jgi:2-oxoglutarate dehydrogenase E2 component (dihydrolipoamide succinyltransferase)
MVEIVVPTLGESVTEATVAQWLKKPGEAVLVDEPLVELETDKVSIEVPAPSSGVLSSISVAEGETVEVGALLGELTGGDGAAKAAVEVAPRAAEVPKTAAVEPAPAPIAPPAQTPAAASTAISPAVRRIAEESELNLASVTGTGKGGRITKGDALAALERPSAPTAKPAPAPTREPRALGEYEERAPMSRLRRTVARRLKEAQETAAILTTFNEVDMSHIMKVRSTYKELFEKKHGVRLGFMSFFTKACLAALKDIPNVNAEIDGTDIIYKNHYDIGVAVGTDKGLVVPVVRDADLLSLGGIELAINELGRKARDGALTLDDLQGGTFTISNGGVYGSLMSTPILNRPQSGILGMHKIQQRPIAIDGQVVVRPMMYLALSYDHRIVDGKEAVTFLVRVKECLEEPERMLLDL